MEGPLCSAGLVFLYLAGIVEDEMIYVRSVNSYQYPFCFAERVRKEQEILAGEEAVGFFCVIGEPERAEAVCGHVQRQIQERFGQLLREEPVSCCRTGDLLLDGFTKAVLSEVHRDEEIRFPRGGSMESQEAGWAMHWIWAGESPDDLRHELEEAVFSVWEEKERPFVAGKQLMIQSFLMRDLNGRRIIGALPEAEDGSWNLVLEGGFLVRLGCRLPYIREPLKSSQLGRFSVREINGILENPVAAYGVCYSPQEVYDQWHKVFLYCAAVAKQDWTLELDQLVRIYERFLEFLGTYICEQIPAETFIPRELYHQALGKQVREVQDYLKGREEIALSKDLLMLLNSRFSYLPYCMELFREPDAGSGEVGDVEFDRDRLLEMLKSSEEGSTFEKGVKLETIAEYVISCIDGLRICGKRIWAGFQEIDLSVVNVSLDN